MNASVLVTWVAFGVMLLLCTRWTFFGQVESAAWTSQYPTGEGNLPGTVSRASLELLMLHPCGGDVQYPVWKWTCV